MIGKCEVPISRTRVLVTRVARWPRSVRVAIICVAITLANGCSKSTTGPGGTLSGHVVLASGQSGDVNGCAVQLYASNPFAPGAVANQSVTATGSATDAGFSFGDLGHGNFYLVAWKDDGDLIVDSGDLRGWYDGAVDGMGNPSARLLQLLHGQNASITIQVSPVP